MAPSDEPEERKWTKFELQVLLALMAKGLHLQRLTYNNDPIAAREATQLNFATELNKALHGDNLRRDIPVKEITRMVKKMLVERKQVVGEGGLVARQTAPRLTRTLTKAWDSKRKMNFDGSIGEWKKGRKLRELNKERATKALAPVVPVVPDDYEDDHDKKQREIAEQWAIATAQRELYMAKNLPVGNGFTPDGVQDPLTSAPQLSGQYEYIYNTTPLSSTILPSSGPRDTQSFNGAVENSSISGGGRDSYSLLRYLQSGSFAPKADDMQVEVGSIADADLQWESDTN